MENKWPKKMEGGKLVFIKTLYVEPAPQTGYIVSLTPRQSPQDLRTSVLFVNYASKQDDWCLMAGYGCFQAHWPQCVKVQHHVFVIMSLFLNLPQDNSGKCKY